MAKPLNSKFENIPIPKLASKSDNMNPGTEVKSERGLGHMATELEEKRVNAMIVQRNLLKSGSASLTDIEVLQRILALSQPFQDAKLNAEILLQEFKTFDNVLNAPVDKLMAVNGVKRAEAEALKIVNTAACHLLRQTINDKPIFKSSDCLKNYLVARLRHEREHVFFILYLDVDFRLIGDEVLCRGTLYSVMVDVREVMRRCLELDASCFIIVRNHPNGDAKPSWQDIKITEEIVKAALLFRVCVIDHIIVAKDKTFSFCEGGLSETITGQPVFDSKTTNTYH